MSDSTAELVAKVRDAVAAQRRMSQSELRHLDNPLACLPWFDQLCDAVERLTGQIANFKEVRDHNAATHLDMLAENAKMRATLGQVREVIVQRTNVMAWTADIEAIDAALGATGRTGGTS